MKQKEKLAKLSEELKAKMKTLENERQEDSLKKQKMQEEVKKQLDRQMEETMMIKKEESSEKEFDRQIRKIKNEYLKQMERKEKETERKSKEEFQQEIQIYLNSEKEIKREKHQLERFEQIKRNAYNNVKDILEEKKKIQEKIRDSEVKTEGLKFFDKLRQEMEGKKRMESEAIKKQAMEIEKRKREERVKFRKKREELRRERKSDKLKSEEEIIMKRMETKKNREREVNDKVERQQCDKRWNEMIKRKEKQRKLEVRLGYMEQWEENEEKRQEEEFWRKCELVDIEKEKEDVIDYCDYTLEQGKTMKRPLFPILTAIKNVKIECGILQPKKNIEHLTSRVPIIGRKI